MGNLPVLLRHRPRSVSPLVRAHKGADARLLLSRESGRGGSVERPVQSAVTPSRATMCRARATMDAVRRLTGGRLWSGMLAGGFTIAVMAVLASSAAAVVATGPNGPIGYGPLNGQGPAASALPFAPHGNLAYHGGPVMHSNTEYAIFWAPAGFSFPAGYEAAAVQYLQDVAADSGK